MMCVSLGYFIEDFFMCILVGPKGAAAMQNYVHHVTSIIGIALSINVGGFMGSICQVSLLTELSTPFVNIRGFIPRTSPLYLVNGILMTGAFFFFRVLWYNFVIFDQFQVYILYRGYHFWELYPKEDHFKVKILLCLSMTMYFLNMFWFSKMFAGLLNALGLGKLFDEVEDEPKASEHKLKKE